MVNFTKETQLYLNADLSETGIIRLSSISPLKEKTIKSIDASLQKKVLLHCIALWDELVAEHKPLARDNFATWCKCFEVLAGTIAVLMPIYLANTHYSELEDICKILGKKSTGKGRQPKTDAQVNHGIYQSIYYIHCVIILLFSKQFEEYKKFSARVEAALYKLFSAYYIIVDNITPESMRVIAHQMLRSLFEIGGDIYSIICDKLKTSGTQDIPGFFPKELDSLARRDESMINQYGRKNVEKIFERQLAFVMQGLGYFVASTRSFEKAIDLVCVSGIQGVHSTIIVEAKTSHKPYALPSKDSRALCDYVEDVKRSLKTLPKLKLLMIVGASPAKTLEKKLKRLESDINIPIRFICARYLADLWGQFPGHVQLDIFERELLNSDLIVNGSFVQSLVKHYKQECKAHEDFIRSLLSIRDAM